MTELPLSHYEEIADRIIRREGFTFVLAMRLASPVDLQDARALLMAAIADALAAEYARGFDAAKTKELT
jgi:hypothetical protein